MKFNEDLMFPKWIEAMAAGDFLFSGGIIPQTKQYSGRGRSRNEFAVEVAGKGLFWRDSAQHSPGYMLVGGYNPELQSYYAYGYIRDNLFRSTWILPRLSGFEHEPVKGALDNVALLYGAQHSAIQGMSKLDALKRSRSGALTAREIQRGAVARVFADLISKHGGKYRGWAPAIGKAFRATGTVGFGDRLSQFGAKVSQEAIDSDRVALVRLLSAVPSPELERFRQLKHGLPEEDAVFWNALDVVDASTVY